MISKVTENIYRGPRLDDLNPLVTFGIKTILNLEDDMNAYITEVLRAKDLNITVLALPMSEILRPKTETLLAAIGKLQEKSFYPIYVHCKHGQDRTGYVIAAYRMRVQGWSFKRAYQETKDMGHKWLFAPYLLLWPKSLHELEITPHAQCGGVNE